MYVLSACYFETVDVNFYCLFYMNCNIDICFICEWTLDKYMCYIWQQTSLNSFEFKYSKRTCLQWLYYSRLPSQRGKGPKCMKVLYIYPHIFVIYNHFSTVLWVWGNTRFREGTWVLSFVSVHLSVIMYLAGDP